MVIGLASARRTLLPLAMADVIDLACPGGRRRLG
jgi:hypothetical protein